MPRTTRWAAWSWTLAAVLGGCSFNAGAGPGGGAGDAGDPPDGVAAIDARIVDARPNVDAVDGAPLPTGLFVRELAEGQEIVLDGTIGAAEWVGIPAITLDPSSADLFLPTTEYIAQGGRNSIGMEVRIAWTADAYYLAVHSTDDTVRTDNGARRQDDAVGFYLNLDGDLDGAIDDFDYELVVRPRAASNDHEIANLGDPLVDIEDAESAAYSDGSGFSIEARLPAGALGVLPAPANLSTIGISIVRWDDDNHDNPGGARSDADATYFWFVGPSTCDACCPAYPVDEERPWCDTSVMTLGVLDGGI